ncbi:hypothetical protein FIBSPDRAFT_942459 [Athelia psychrophila]|uniref:Uncharacterized protein n=1 Tax=Athelia psychrophila TaxID=1759441 RepID=A0A166X193_9AGAM|nr:hypothetical protein FIBSPDRAFT_942459 [Fibularhizoctonia sp. CBS 109695]
MRPPFLRWVSCSDWRGVCCEVGWVRAGVRRARGQTEKKKRKKDVHGALVLPVAVLLAHVAHAPLTRALLAQTRTQTQTQTQAQTQTPPPKEPPPEPRATGQFKWRTRERSTVTRPCLVCAYASGLNREVAGALYGARLGLVLAHVAAPVAFQAPDAPPGHALLRPHGHKPDLHAHIAPLAQPRSRAMATAMMPKPELKRLSLRPLPLPLPPLRHAPHPTHQHYTPLPITAATFDIIYTNPPLSPRAWANTRYFPTCSSGVYSFGDSSSGKLDFGRRSRLVSRRPSVRRARVRSYGQARIQVSQPVTTVALAFPPRGNILFLHILPRLMRRRTSQRPDDPSSLSCRRSSRSTPLGSTTSHSAISHPQPSVSSRSSRGGKSSSRYAHGPPRPLGSRQDSSRYGTRGSAYRSPHGPFLRGRLVARAPPTLPPPPQLDAIRIPALPHVLLCPTLRLTPALLALHKLYRASPPSAPLRLVLLEVLEASAVLRVRVLRLRRAETHVAGTRSLVARAAGAGAAPGVGVAGAVGVDREPQDHAVDRA